MYWNNKVFSLTDEEEDLIAGQCHCKSNVDGARCDRCKNGFWNFTLENPEGCQGTFLNSHMLDQKLNSLKLSVCMCNLDGIVSNDGCDQLTGECSCKRFVVGRDCDQVCLLCTVSIAYFNGYIPSVLLIIMDYLSLTHMDADLVIVILEDLMITFVM